MSPEKKEKRTWLVRNAILALSTISVGLLSFIGYHIIPFTKDAYAKWKEDKEHEKKIDEHLDKVDTALLSLIKNDSTKDVITEKRFVAIEQKQSSLESSQQTTTQTIGMINTTVSSILQSRTPTNKNFLNNE